MMDVLIPYAQETLTIADSVLPLTVAVYKTGQHKEVRRAFITVETASIRFWTGGGTPVAGSVGHLVESGGTIELTLPGSVMGFRAVRDGSTSAVLQVTYEGDV